MTTIKKGHIEYEIHAAPETPLNLRMSVIYAPRKRNEFGGSFEGYNCVEVEPGYFVVAGWGRGRTATIWEGESLPKAYAELATALGLTQ